MRTSTRLRSRRVVQRLGGARERRLAGDLRRVLLGQPHLGEAGGRRRGEGARHLDLVRREAAAGRRGPGTAGGERRRRSASARAGAARAGAAAPSAASRPAASSPRAPAAGASVVDQLAQRREVVDRKRPARAGPRRGSRRAPPAVPSRPATDSSTARRGAEELARLVDQPLAHGVGPLRFAATLRRRVTACIASPGAPDGRSVRSSRSAGADAIGRDGSISRISAAIPHSLTSPGPCHKPQRERLSRRARAPASWR